MTQNTARRLRLSAAQALLGSVGVALLTYICYRLHLDVATTALVDVIAVVLLSLTGNFISSAVVSITAALCLHYFFVAPLFSWGLYDPLEIVALAAFLTTTLVITRLLSRVRESLREAQTARDQLRLAIDTIPALVWTSLPDGSSEFSNERWLEYTGLSREEAQAWGYKAAFHPEDYERLLPRWTAGFAAGTPIENEARLRRADGVYRWFLHRAVPLRDELGNIVKWYGTSFDIEDRMRAKDVLREQARLLDLTHDTVFVRDMNNVITYWNRGAEELYGWTREEAIGKVTHQLMQTVFPAPLEEITATLLSTGRWEGELVHTRRDGTRVTVASRWSLQRDEKGQPAGTLETNNDITPRKQAEDALRRSEAYLAEAQRLSHTGSFGWDVASGELVWSDETFRIFQYDRANTGPTVEVALQRVHPEDPSCKSASTAQRVWGRIGSSIIAC
jgi:PAS domain S-box-containing protein